MQGAPHATPPFDHRKTPRFSRFDGRRRDGSDRHPAANDAAPAAAQLHAGEGVVDITPPLGIEMGGFHRPPGKERRIQGIRQPSAVRALVLELGGVRVAICSLDVAAVGKDMAARIRSQVARQTGIPAENVRVCGHAHPFHALFLLLAAVGHVFGRLHGHGREARPSRPCAGPRPIWPRRRSSLGKCRARGGNHNRTTKAYKTDAAFAKESSDAERWLDTMLHALLFHRSGGKRTLAWYHFNAHAVCYADEIAGPDWPGEVAELVPQEREPPAVVPPGARRRRQPGRRQRLARRDPADRRGDLSRSAQQAIRAATPVKIDTLRTTRAAVPRSARYALLKDWLAEYAKDPAKCTASALGRRRIRRRLVPRQRGTQPEPDPPADHDQRHCLGPIGMLFHPAELYSCYGLTIRRDSPFADTLVVGYADGIIGYLPDPNAYKAHEYAAIVVPKILDYPPFTPTAARQFTAAGLGLLKAVQ